MFEVKGKVKKQSLLIYMFHLAKSFLPQELEGETNTQNTLPC